MTEKIERKKTAKKSRKAAKERGRPAWRPTIEDRQTVERMKYCGESDAVIARSLRVDVDTLRKHCPDEIADGYAQRRKQVINWLFDSAQDGHAASRKTLDQIGRSVGAQSVVPDSAPKPPKLGKKEERQAAAEAVASGSSIFAPPAPPKLVVNNG
jgi:hypothetical protein